MMFSNKSPHVYFIFLLTVLLLSACSSKKPEEKEKITTETLPQYVYSATAEPVAKVQAVQLTAKANNKLLLVVLGAQWCHDSTGLAARFSTPEMQTILKERFETVFIDVGYYQDLRDVTRLFDYPGYYATPLVMVVDPNTSTLLNLQSLSQFNKADSIPFNDYLRYFSTVGLEKETITHLSQNPEVIAFAEQQTQRLFAGFKVLNPLFKEAFESEPKEFDKIKALFEEIFNFRMTLQKDIHWLHRQAILDEKSDQVCLLDFPSYGPFSWEAKEK